MSNIAQAKTEEGELIPVNDTILSGCIAAAGALFHAEQGLPEPQFVLRYAVRLYAEAAKQGLAKV